MYYKLSNQLVKSKIVANLRMTSIFMPKASLNQVRSVIRAGMRRAMAKTKQARSPGESPGFRALGRGDADKKRG